MKTSILVQLKMEAAGVVTIPFVNWASPSMIQSSQQQAQIQILSYILKEGEDNIALSINPVFSYKKGQVWMMEHMLMKSCAMAGSMNVDMSFALNFKGKPDFRDKRPLMCPGRILTQSGKDVAELWKSLGS